MQTDWQLAQKYHTWNCFFCKNASNKSFVHSTPIFCDKKGKYFKISYRCKAYFELEDDKKRLFLFLQKEEKD